MSPSGRIAALVVVLALAVTACRAEVRYTNHRKSRITPSPHVTWTSKVRPVELEGRPVAGDRKLDTRPARSRGLTEKELFGGGSLKSLSGTLTYRRVEQHLTSFCRDAVWGVERALLDADCEQVARAVYLSDDQRYQALVALIDVRDRNAAERLRAALDGRAGFLSPARGTRFHHAVRWDRARVTGVGHYVTVTWLQPVDAARTSPDGAAEFARNAPRDPWARVLRARY
ncbi:hypothetical protein [Actinomadura kijaniata]|uniref:hypothetical protein n=1 Tax=Actinomadura kijaniata TaxID=46161 RepID=UPI0008373FFF|nr:hypothetical protein [Actinomadura kijaniata]